MTKTSPLPSPKQKTTKFQTWIAVVSIVVGLIALIFLGWGLVSLYKTLFPHEPNYAEEVAKPLETALVGVGAVKIKSNGDAGKGWDNNEPWFNATYSLAKDRVQAEKLIYIIATDNGYTLTHASPDNKGPLEYVVDDQYIQDWYFDNTSQKSAFADLKDGPVRLAIKLDHAEDQSTTIHIQVRLPVFKQ
ncbi:MAG TPA: hypothetical protein VFT87_02845 [Candidatus Saccharimonadales bacterium]|nr:hypothetical protein [Candidatus Saccharimonadales bacterium]